MIVHLVPHACQQITVDQTHRGGDTVAKICGLAESEGTKTVSLTNSQKKMSHGVKSRERGGKRINVYVPFVGVLSTFVASFNWDTIARLCGEPLGRLVERCNHYCRHSNVASASFLTGFTNFWITPFFNWGCTNTPFAGWRCKFALSILYGIFSSLRARSSADLENMIPSLKPQRSTPTRFFTTMSISLWRFDGLFERRIQNGRT